LITLNGTDISHSYIAAMLKRKGEVKLKENACIQVNHHKEVSAAIADMQNQGWCLHIYQASGFGTDVKHYLLFEKGN
jgi:hypothetical protein